MTKNDWVAREHRMLSVLQAACCIGAVPDIRHIDQVYRNFGPDDRYVPGGLDAVVLVNGLPSLGVKVRERKIPPKFEKIPGESGVISCDIGSVMRPTDLQDAPFMLSMERHIEWANMQGGQGIMSAEEVLYVLARSAVEFQRLPFSSGWVRTRNKVKIDECGVVAYSVEFGGLEVGLTDNLTRRPSFGAIPRKFVGVAA